MVGSGVGQGPVAHGEIVALGICLSTPPEGGKVTAKAFKTSLLQDGDLSLSRIAYTDTPTFQTKVVAPKAASDPIQGVAICSVSTLRDIYINVPKAQPPSRIRGACVLDKVETGDHEGHATLEYCEEQNNIKNPNTKGMVRAAIAIALASAFGDVHPVDAIFPP